MPRLPIDEARDAFVAAARESKPIVVSAPTGSGKSTRLPGWLLDAGASRVMVVEPRRIAARALATWVARQRGTPVGTEVGYQVRFDGQQGPDTKILFVTPGVALSMMAGESAEGVAPGLAHFDAVLIDEFHERAWEVDLAVALVRLARARDGRPALVVCSATLAEATLQDALHATVVRSEGRSFAVEIEYRGDGPPSDRDLAERTAAAVQAALASREGDVLAFLPGKAEIGRTVRALANCDAAVVPVHSGIDPRTLSAALAEAPHRRVFVATNVAETSLTLPGVRTVVDSGLARMQVHRAGHSVLALVPISAASAEQRAGRAGRISAGSCIRLWSPHYSPEPHTPPALLRVELDDAVLRAAAAGLSGDALAAAPWVTEPPAFALSDARRRLAAAGDLDADGRLTPRGRQRARLPVSAWAGRILTNPPPSIAGLLADVVALADLRRDLVLPGSTAPAVDEARAALFQGCPDEVEVQLRALWDGDAARHGLHRGALAEARAIAGQLRARVGAPRRERGLSLAAHRDALVSHLLDAVPESAFVPRSGRRMRTKTPGSATAWGNGQSEIMLRPPSIPGVDPDAQPPAPRAAIVLDLAWIGVGRGAQGRGRLALACRTADLLAAGIGEAEVGPPILAKQGRRRIVVADVQITRGSTVLDRERIPLTGPPLVDGIATLILDGRFTHLDADEVLDRLHVAELLRQIAPLPDELATTPVASIVARLHTLGVAGLEDIELVEAHDLAPDLDAEALRRGIDPGQPAALLADFPRRWSFDGTRYDCTVQWTRRCVTLTPLRASGKLREPPAKVLPRFRGFAVEYRKASRIKKLR